MMGILYEKVQLSNELKKQIIIRQLLDLGITEHQGQSIYDLDYYSLRHLLVIQRVKQ
jgi:hypothetical protein